jgi:hypothetical protein
MEGTTYEELKEQEARALRRAGAFRMLAEEAKKSEVKSKGIEAWRGYHFESSSGLTEEWASFSQHMKAYLKKTLAPEFEMVSYSRGHFYFSVFMKNKNGKMVYISCNDVRYSPGYSPEGWYNNLLVRTAEHEKDYTGGRNNYSTLEGLKEQAINLTQ